MIYKTVVVSYSPFVNNLAKKIEDAANEWAKKGYELVTFSVTPGAKAILMLRNKEENE